MGELCPHEPAGLWLVEGPSAGLELGATPRERALFPTVWFTGLEGPHGRLLVRCPRFQRSEGEEPVPQMPQTAGERAAPGLRC